MGPFVNFEVYLLIMGPYKKKNLHKIGLENLRPKKIVSLKCVNGRAWINLTWDLGRRAKWYVLKFDFFET